MKAFKSIFILLFLLTLFVGNIGVSIYTHSCEEDGVMVSYVFNDVDEHCQGEDETEACCKKDLPPCCQKETTDDDCCTDEYAYHNIKLDYVNGIPSFEFQKVVCSAVLLSDYTIPECDIHINQHTINYENPPPRESRSYQSLFQVWII